MNRIPSIIQLAGMATFTVGVWMYSAVAGMIVSGVILTLVGVALERSE